jgi:hypothetical protein
MFWRLSPSYLLMAVVGIFAHFRLELWIVLGVCAAISLGNQLVLTARIHRRERAEPRRQHDSR